MTDRFPGATIQPFEGKHPQIHETAFVAPGARIIGDVRIGAQASIWYNCVLRADIHYIEVGARSNVQDGTVIHVEGPRPDTDGCPTIIGEDCLIGHTAIVHGVRMANRAFIGMGAIAMGRLRGRRGRHAGSGSAAQPSRMIPPSEIWVGRPAKMFRQADAAQAEKIRFQSERYCRLAERHLAAIRGETET